MQPQQNPYDFILDPKLQPPPKGFRAPNGKQKIIFMVGLIAGVGVLIAIGVTIILSFGKIDNSDLVLVRANQTEILRIIDLGKKDLSDQTLKNRLASVEAAVTSDDQNIAGLLKGRKEVVLKSTLNSLTNSKVEEQLAAAKQDGSYDTVLLEFVQKQSGAYYNSLTTALGNATTKTESDILSTAITNIESIADK